MSNSSIKQSNHYLVLEPTSGKRILSAEETLIWLSYQVSLLSQLPNSIKRLTSSQDQAQWLFETCGELEFFPGRKVQWFAIRF
uniref:Uncharacterized protein n=1 Tax=Paulinella chromatophora TaxID=39717 RepID=B1X463_PAUCH|nr:hypothetical protein PCC_0290 [Paulinella chromatophora]ACB42732.1 hypothetical protein PCC_0290 [Paulinella chromatophora]